MSNWTRTLAIAAIASVVFSIAALSPSNVVSAKAASIATQEAQEAAGREDLLGRLRSDLAQIKIDAARAKATTRSQRVIDALDRIWTLADGMEKALPVRPTEPPATDRPDRPPTRPPPTDPPPTRPPPVDPPPTRPPPVDPTTFAPEQFWEHSAYMDAIGNLTMRDCTFGVDWTTKPTTYYSTWGDQSGDFAGESWASTEWGCWGGTGLAQAVLNLYGPVQSQILFTDCAWLAAPDPSDGSFSMMRWGIRGFGMMDVVFDRCAFSRGMGAGTQVTLRASAAYGNIFPTGLHRYERCTYIGIGDPQSERWGAFTISEHEPEGYGVDFVPVQVEIIDCSLIGGHISWTDPNGKLVKSPRGIMIHGRERVEIRGLRLDYEAPYEGWAMQIWDCPEVTIADSYVREGTIELRNCGKISVLDCGGNAFVQAGTHANDAKPFPMEFVVYSGPISADWSQQVKSP